MKKENWAIDDLPWDSFDPCKLRQDHLMTIKAAALIKCGAEGCEKYLSDIFSDDPIFQRAIGCWASEERHHGETLGRYAAMADPYFKFGKALSLFRKEHKIGPKARHAARASKTSELIGRCVFKAAFCQYYAGLGRVTDEPLLRTICRNLAEDEFKHFGMFYSHLAGYVRHERAGRFNRLRAVADCIKEAGGDELAFAYHAANAPDNYPYKRQVCLDAFLTRAFTPCSREDVRSFLTMMLKVCGLAERAFWHGLAERLAWRTLQSRLFEANSRLA